MPKASEVFLMYVEPIMDPRIPNPPIDQLQRLLNAAALIWNALALQERGTAKQDYMKLINDELNCAPASERAFMKPLVDLLAERKRQLFPEAKWCFDVSVRAGKEGPIVRAAIRIPEHLKHTVPKEWQGHENVRFVDFKA